MEQPSSEAKSDEQAQAKTQGQKPTNGWGPIFSGAVNELTSHSWLPNLLIGLALLLIWPLIGATFMDSRKATIIGFGIGATILVWIGVVILVRQTVSEPKQESSALTPAPNTQDAPKANMPSTSVAAHEGRPLLDVKPEYLAGFWEKYNDAQAQRLVETYIGKWTQISGEVSEVSQYHSEPNGAVASMRTTTPPRLSIIAEFEEKRWVDRVLVLKRSESITVFGKITKITALGPGYVTFWLDKCEVIE